MSSSHLTADPVIRARIESQEEQERIDRFLVYQRGQNAGMGGPVRAKFSRVKAIGLVIAGGCGAILFLAWGAMLDKAHGAEREITCTRVQVTDGDTLRCNGNPVRLEGIDAPECSHYPCRDSASRRLRSLSTDGTLRCTITGRDEFGRNIGRCSSTVTGDVGDDLVGAGVARRWHYGREPKPYKYRNRR